MIATDRGIEDGKEGRAKSRQRSPLSSVHQGYVRVIVQETMSWAFVVAKFSSETRSSPLLRTGEEGDVVEAIFVCFLP